MDCPSDCEYLQEGRKHEPLAEFDPATMGHPDIRVTEEFLESHALLTMAIGRGVIVAASLTGAVDSDIREAFASLIQTYRTLQSGVIYESLPANPLAANICRAVQEAVAVHRQEEARQSGLTRTRDNDVLRVLVFFERLALDRNNGRRRSRAFLDLIRTFQPESESADNAPPSLILP